jgi:hypothetical protein
MVQWFSNGMQRLVILPVLVVSFVTGRIGCRAEQHSAAMDHRASPHEPLMLMSIA